MGFVDHSGPNLAAGDKPLDVEWPVRWCGHPAFVAVPSSGQRCPNWHRAHRTGEVGIAGDGPTRTGSSCAAAGDGRSFDAEHLSQLLVVRFRAIQRRRELLYSTVLDAKPRHFPLESGDERGVAHDRPRERQESHNRYRDGASAPLPRLDGPTRETVLFGFKIAIRVDHNRDGAGAPLFLRHPSKGAPRITSSSRARSSFE